MGGKESTQTRRRSSPRGTGDVDSDNDAPGGVPISERLEIWFCNVLSVVSVFHQHGEKFGLLYERGRRDGATEIHWGRIGGRSGKLMQRAAWVVHRLARLRRLANGDVRKLEYASRL